MMGRRFRAVAFDYSVLIWHDPRMTTTQTTNIAFTKNRYSGNYSAQTDAGVFSIVRIQRRFAGAFELSLHNNGNIKTLTNGTLAYCKQYANIVAKREEVTTTLINDYRAARDAYMRACEQSDEAFRRYMHGEVRTARGAGRLAQKVENTGGACDHARYDLMDAGVDPDAIDAADGMKRDPWGRNYHKVTA